MTALRRRQLLRGALALGAGWALPLRAAEGRLGEPWLVARGAPLELWPARLGLDLGATLAAIAQWRIAPGARLVLRLDDGIHAQSGTLNLAHPDGARLAIVGNVAQPARCTLAWSGPEDGLYAGAGTVLGWLDGVTLVHGAPRARGQGSAVLADEGGVIRCGSAVAARHFYYGFQARFGGVIACGGSSSRGAGDANYFAFNGGHINAPGARADEARDADLGLGSGFVAEYGGTINATDAQAQGNLLAGYTALSNGVIRAYRASASRNGGAGFYTNTGGIIVAHEGQAQANCGPGLLARDGASGITGNHIVEQHNMAAPATCRP